MGDAHMRPQDAALAAESVRKSIAQVLDAAAGRSRGYGIPPAATAAAGPDDFDVCKSATFPDRGAGLGTGRGQYGQVLVEVLLDTPVPALGPGLGSLPRARSEVGAFMGLAASINGRGVNGGFEASQNENGFIAGLDLGFRVGLGLEGALGDAGDGLAFLQVGLAADGPSTNKFSETGLGTLGGSLSAAIPARSGLSTRIRMPYYLIPGDLLFLSPMYFFNPEKYTQLAVTASNGGLLRWQQGLGHAHRPIPVRAGARARRDLLWAMGRPAVGRATRSPRRRRARGQLQVDVLRPADPRVPSLPRVLRKPELDCLVPAVRRRGRALRRIGGCSDRRSATESAHGLVGRPAHDL